MIMSETSNKSSFSQVDHNLGVPDDPGPTLCHEFYDGALYPSFKITYKDRHKYVPGLFVGENFIPLANNPNTPVYYESGRQLLMLRASIVVAGITRGKHPQKLLTKTRGNPDYLVLILTNFPPLPAPLEGDRFYSTVITSKGCEILVSSNGSTLISVANGGKFVVLSQDGSIHRLHRDDSGLKIVPNKSNFAGYSYRISLVKVLLNQVNKNKAYKNQEKIREEMLLELTRLIVFGLNIPDISAQAFSILCKEVERGIDPTLSEEIHRRINGIKKDQLVLSQIDNKSS